MEPRIEYVAIAEVKKYERNPKGHDLDAIAASIGRFGYVAPLVVDEKSGTLASGHGRVEALERMKAAGQAPPERVKTLENGDWAVPVLRGVAFKSDADLARYVIAANRLVEKGGWVEESLIAVLEDLLAEGALTGTGYGEDDMKALQQILAARERDAARKLVEGKCVLVFKSEADDQVREALKKLAAAFPEITWKEDTTV